MPMTLFRRRPVRQALDCVARGTGAGVVKDEVPVVATIPEVPAISGPIATVAGAPKAATARRFVGLLATAPAQAALGHCGFGKP